MSQQKVEKYKKEKQNRKKIIAKQKRQKFMRNCAYVLVLAAFIGFIGFSVYKDYIYKEPSSTEPATFSLSEKEISKVWSDYEKSDSEESSSSDENNTTSSEGDTTSNEDETTSGENETSSN